MKRIVTLCILVALLAPVALTAQAGPGAGVMAWLHDNMGMEMGSVTIDGIGYSKVVLSPEVKMGRLKLGLYLPVIYKDDLFNPSTWYAPGGNNEWNFGADYWGTNTMAALLDVAADLILKIKYIEFGQPLDDPFFVKVGSLHGLNIGHGLIMRDYRNDSDFPSVRRTGLNFGLDFGAVGFEALANDLPIPDIVGTRLYVRPIKGSRLAFGISGVADLAAGRDLAGSSWDVVSDKFVFIGTGVDLDFPIIKANEILSLRAFADAAITVPYMKAGFTSPNAGATETIQQGIQTDLVWASGPKNWGAAAGFIGNVLFIDYRLEYRYFTGIFRPSFFDATYERARSLYVQQYVGYLDGTSTFSDAPTVMGVYGEAGFSLFKDRLSLKAGYMWPWSLDAGFSLGDADDELHASIVIKKGLIPVVDVAGAIYYDKWGLVSSIANGTFSFFDSKTALAGEVDIPVPGTPNLSVAAIFKAVVARNATGDVLYVDDDPTKGPEIVPSITIETRFRF